MNQTQMTYTIKYLFPFTVRLILLPVWLHTFRQFVLLQIYVKLLRNGHKSANLKPELSPGRLIVVATIRDHSFVVEFVFVEEVSELLNDTLG